MNNMQRKEARRVALVHVCYLAEEAAHPRFLWPEGQRMSTVLTVNAGYE